MILMIEEKSCSTMTQSFGLVILNGVPIAFQIGTE